MLGVLRERECPRCGRAVDLPLGALCATCLESIERRARRIAHLVAGVTTLILAVYLFIRTPPVPNARLVAGIGVAAWYVLTGIVARRVLREALK